MDNWHEIPADKMTEEQLRQAVKDLRTALIHDVLPSTPSSDIITNRRMDPMDNKVEPVPYRAFESAMARMDRHNRWLIIVIVILVILLAGSNAYWVYESYSFETDDEFTVEIDSDDDSNANYLNGDGEINNGGKGESYEA